MSCSLDIKQLSVGGLDHNFSYIVHCPETEEGMIVDPCGDAEIIRAALAEFPRVRPKYIAITHGHRDHWDALSAVSRFFPAPVAASKRFSGPVDIRLDDRRRLPLGRLDVECLETPGHSPDSMVFRLTDNSAIFTGDTLFIDCCGYCAPKEMFRTFREIILPLAGSHIVYSGHDYGRIPFDTLENERKTNPYLRAETFAEFREQLKKL